MYLGIDLGTSGVKTVLLDDTGAVIQQANVSLELSRPQPEWSEQNPDDWWNALTKAISQLDAAKRKMVRGVGLSGQMHGAVLLDENDTVLRPAILWNDGRSQKQCDELLCRAPFAHRITGNPILAGFTAPKLLWVREEEPDIFVRIRRILLPKDYLRLRMTGEFWTDMSDASGTLWLDVGKRQWSPDMLEACGVSVDAMPQLAEGCQTAGILRADVAKNWGMERVVVAAGGGDNAAGAVGLGIVEPGDAFLSLGTSGVIFVVTDGFRPNPSVAVHAFAHALPMRWHRMSVMLSAASCLDWATRLLRVGDVAALLQLAETANERSTLLFLPYLSGERTPHADPSARAGLIGMGGGDGPAEVARAVLDGVAMGLADGLDALTGSGSTVGSITVAGGGSRSRFWGGRIAAALDRPLVWRQGGEVGPALGAARLGRLAAGDGSIEVVCAQPTIVSEVTASAEMIEKAAERQERFRRAWPAASLSNIT